MILGFILFTFFCLFRNLWGYLSYGVLTLVSLFPRFMFSIRQTWGRYMHLKVNHRGTHPSFSHWTTSRIHGSTYSKFTPDIWLSVARIYRGMSVQLDNSSISCHSQMLSATWTLTYRREELLQQCSSTSNHSSPCLLSQNSPALVISQISPCIIIDTLRQWAYHFIRSA